MIMSVYFTAHCYLHNLITYSQFEYYCNCLANVTIKCCELLSNCDKDELLPNLFQAFGFCSVDMLLASNYRPYMNSNNYGNKVMHGIGKISHTTSTVHCSDHFNILLLEYALVA
jgi:hypothetical protein